MTPSTDWKEQVAPGEEARFERYAQQLASLQQRNKHAGTAGRALHHKGHGVFEASLEIDADVPPHARHGLFARPARYEALVRFSNGSGKVQPDRTGDVRGIAVKVLGVEGAKVLGNASTQDFLAILSSSTPFRTADEFVGVVWATRTPALALFRLLGTLGPRALGLVKKLVAGLKVPAAPLASRPFYSALPIQCGPYAVRYAFRPLDGEGVEPLTTTPTFHADALAAQLRKGPLRYELALQFFVDEATTPIEDASVDWSSPYTRVGVLTIAQQDSASERGTRLTEKGEHLSFDPWHALVEHKPLGGMMRARKAAYFASTQGRTTSAEPTSIAALTAP